MKSTAYTCKGVKKSHIENNLKVLSKSIVQFDVTPASCLSLVCIFRFFFFLLPGASILFFIVGLAVLFKGFVPAAWLGLALSFAVEMTTFLKHAVRMFAQSEGQMASVERLMQVQYKYMYNQKNGVREMSACLFCCMIERK